MSIRSDVTGGSETGFFLKFTNYTYIRNTIVLHCKNLGIALYVTRVTEISNTTVLDPVVDGIHLVVSTSTTIINTTIDARGNGIILQLSRNIKIRNTVFMHCQIYVSFATDMNH